MLWWLDDNLGTVYLLLGMVALGVAAAFFHTRRVKYLGIFFGLIVIAVLFKLLDHYVITDREQLELNTWEMAEAVRDHKVDKLLTHLADNFEYMGIGREEVARGVIGTAKAYHVSGFYLWDFDIQELNRPQKKAKIAFRIRVDHGGDTGFLGLCRSEFILDPAGKWRVSKFQVFNPVVNSDAPISIPIHR